MEKNANIDFSSNLMDIDKSLSREEYVNRVVTLLKPILQKTFPNDFEKQQIKIHRDRINFACPICMDSMQSSHKKRGNIILTGKHSGFYKCFNCSNFSSVNNFFKDFKINLELDVINYISDNLGNFTTPSRGYDISLLMDIETIEKYAIDRSKLKNNFNLIEVKESSIWPWLKKRLQYTTDKFLFNPSENYLLILNLTPSGKIIGSQKRLFKGFNKYLTFSASKLHELIDKEEVPEEVDIISQIFGILQINLSLPIILLEGPFDSFLINNSIANAGANKQFNIELPVKYLYDKDKTGVKKSIEHINKGDDVFLWEKFLNNLDAPYRKKWDINDIFVWAKNNNKKIPNILNYFSKDPLDIIDI